MRDETNRVGKNQAVMKKGNESSEEMMKRKF